MACLIYIGIGFVAFKSKSAVFAQERHPEKQEAHETTETAQKSQNTCRTDTGVGMQS